MKIAVSSEGPDLKSRLGHRLGLAPYLILVDLESGEFEAIRSPAEPVSGVGMQVVALIIAKKCEFLLTGYCSPVAEKYLSGYGVKVVTGLKGTIEEILKQYEKAQIFTGNRNSENIASALETNRKSLADAARKALHQIQNLLPVMISVVFLVGVFNTFITRECLTSLFSGSLWLDPVLGAFIGSLFAGNPINSYIIGGQLLELGVGLTAVTAFLCSWITVGLVQMPAEIASLGWKFAFLRNISCFGLSIVISLVMVFMLRLL